MLHAVAKHYAHLADIQNVLEKKKKRKNGEMIFYFSDSFKKFPSSWVLAMNEQTEQESSTLKMHC